MAPTLRLDRIARALLHLAAFLFAYTVIAFPMLLVACRGPDTPPYVL